MLAFVPRSLRWLLAMGVGLVTQVGHAQSTTGPIQLLPEDAQRGLNGHQHNFYFLPPGKTGENYENAGFFGQRLRPYLAGSAEALDALGNYRRQKTVFLVDRLVSIGALGVYGQQVLAKDGERQYFNGTQQVAIGVFAASILATLFINRNTNNHLQRAVKAYNAGPGTGAHYPWLRPSAVGLGLGPAGAPVLALGWRLR